MTSKFRPNLSLPPGPEQPLGKPPLGFLVKRVAGRNKQRVISILRFISNVLKALVG